MYRRWLRLLPDWVRLVPVELPGRGSRMSESFVESFDELVTQLCAEQERSCRGSYALFGHSMGGLLAHAMAVRLRDAGRTQPQFLFVSGAAAPSCRDPDFFVGKDTDTALVADLRRQGGTPEEIFQNAEMLGLTLQTLRADYRVCAGYRARVSAPLRVPLHVFAGRDDDVGPERILAWKQETASDFSVRWFDGGHFFIRPHESTLVNAIVETLWSACSESGSACGESADVPAVMA